MNVLRVLALATLWCVLTRELSVANVALGLALGAALVALTGRQPGASRSPSSTDRTQSALALGRRALLRPWLAFELAAYFLWELLVSSVRIALLVLRPDMRFRTMIVAVPTQAESDAELAIVSDLVTLTPGTLCLDVENDGRTLIVHVMCADDAQAVRRQIDQGLALRVRRLFA